MFVNKFYYSNKNIPKLNSDKNNSFSSGQGTIEYLIILGVIVVISLLVVFLITSLNDENNTGIKSNDLFGLANSITIKEVAVTLDGNGLVYLGNNTGENLTITKISLNGNDTNYLPKTMIQGEYEFFPLIDLTGCSCENLGKNRVDCELKIFYETSNGISQVRILKINVDCVNEINIDEEGATPDTFPPVINLISPENNSLGRRETTFSFNASDSSGISSCELIIDGVVDQTINSQFTSFTKTFDDIGSFVWDVNCVDIYGNEGKSSSWDYNVTYLPSLLLSGTNNDSLYSLAQAVSIDPSGNIYVGGIILKTSPGGTLDFGNSVTLDFDDETDFFIVKYNALGEAQWVRTTESSSGEDDEFLFNGNGIFATADGVYVTIYYNSSNLDLGDGFTFNNQGGYDFLLIKYNSNGDIDFVKTSTNSSGTSFDSGIAVINDNEGNIYLAGDTRSDINFGGDIAIDTGHQNFNDFYLAKYDSVGNPIWAITDFENNEFIDTYSNGLAIDSDNNVYLCGITLGPVNFGNGVVLSYDGGTHDIYLVKFNSDGVAQWVLDTTSGSDTEYANSVAVDSQDNIYLTGFTKSNLDFGNGVTVTNSGNADYFLLKLNSSGVAQWVRTGGANANDLDWGKKVVIDSEDNIYVSGYYKSNSIDFGNSFVFNDADGNSDFFVVKYNSGGDTLWTTSSFDGSNNPNESRGLDVFDNKIYVSGNASGDLNFGNGFVYNTQNNISEFFVVVYEN